MKPDTTTAMSHLITQVREAIPFDLPEAYICSGNCNGCSQKLIDFLDMEIINWENKLEAGDKPNFGDLHRLANMSRKIYRVLDRNNLIQVDTQTPQNQSA